LPDPGRIRALNDQARTTLTGCRVLVTPSLVATCDVSAVLNHVRAFCTFTSDNDPYDEHDFGSFEHEGQVVLWKMDYYDTDMLGMSLDPSDPAVTTRVLTVMLAEDY
jgi:hypothetical protein